MPDPVESLALTLSALADKVKVYKAITGQI